MSKRRLDPTPAGPGQRAERVQHVRAIPLELLDDHAGEAVGDTKAPLESLDEIEHEPAGGSVALVGHFAADRGVAIVVKGMSAAIENGVSPQAEWLMNLEIEANRRHRASCLGQRTLGARHGAPPRSRRLRYGPPAARTSRS